MELTKWNWVELELTEWNWPWCLTIFIYREQQMLKHGELPHHNQSDNSNKASLTIIVGKYIEAEWKQIKLYFSKMSTKKIAWQLQCHFNKKQMLVFEMRYITQIFAKWWCCYTTSQAIKYIKCHFKISFSCNEYHRLLKVL